MGVWQVKFPDNRESAGNFSSVLENRLCSLRKYHATQVLMQKFPVHRSREFRSSLQGHFAHKQGKFVSRRKTPFFDSPGVPRIYANGAKTSQRIVGVERSHSPFRYTQGANPNYSLSAGVSV